MVCNPLYIRRCLIFFYVWEGIGEIMLSTSLHNSWERGCIAMECQPNLAVDVSQLMK